MSKLLYVKANPKPAETSRTFQVSDDFIETYRKSHPADEIITLDLYKKNINFLSDDDIRTVFGPKTEASMKHPILQHAYAFLNVDKYVIAAPFWNLGLPAILKAYIDYVTVTGVTFKYTENGPVGLCTGKKAVHIVSRGGHYMEGPATGFEMGDRYLRVLFGFLGIVDIETIAIEGVDVVGADIEGIVAKSIKRSRVIAEDF